MIRMDLTPVRALMAFLMLFVVLLGGCARPVATDREARLASLDPEARRLYAQLEHDHLLRHDRQVLEVGEQLLAAPFARRLPVDVVTMMIVSALRLPDPDRAREIAVAVPSYFPEEAPIEIPMLKAAAGFAEAGQPGIAIQILSVLVNAVADPHRRRAALQKVSSLVDLLDDAEIHDMQTRYAGTPLSSLIQAESKRRHIEPAVDASRPVRHHHLGVLVPLTGRFARFGNAFLSGVRLAAEDVPSASAQPWRIVCEDTEGDVVAAALAARRLIEEQNCGVLIGALLSTTTATAALVADRLGVPLVSPTATHERLGLLGENVLQTNRTGPTEVEILARLMCEVLLKVRFAVIRSDSHEGRELAEVFSQAVARHGGRVIHEEVFDPAATDFRPQVERLRAARPEVVYAQASVDQMILLGPQLDFYRVGALVLGTGEWNSSRLLQRAGSVMERAIFPVSEVLYPADWSAAFDQNWPAGKHDEESTRIARSAYLAARLVLQSLATEARDDAGHLVARLQAGLAGHGVDLDGWETFGAAVRLIQDEQIVPFPIHLYAEALRRSAPADSTTGDLSDAQLSYD